MDRALRGLVLTSLILTTILAYIQFENKVLREEIDSLKDKISEITSEKKKLEDKVRQLLYEKRRIVNVTKELEDKLALIKSKYNELRQRCNILSDIVNLTKSEVYYNSFSISLSQREAWGDVFIIKYPGYLLINFTSTTNVVIEVRFWYKGNKIVYCYSGSRGSFITPVLPGNVIVEIFNPAMPWNYTAIASISFNITYYY